LPDAQRLPEREEMFSPPVAPQALGEDIAAGFDAMIFQRRQLLRIAFVRGLVSSWVLPETCRWVVTQVGVVAL
jgi:hypothetical protein